MNTNDRPNPTHRGPARLGWRSFLAEGTGALIVVLFGFLTLTAPGPSDSILLESTGFGVGLFSAGYAFGAVSHRHFNPAMTWAAYLGGRLDTPSLLGSWLAQLAGGVAAAAGLRWLAGPPALDAAAATTGSVLQPLAVETLLSAVFAVVVLVASRYGDRRMATVLAMSLAYFGVHVVGLPWGGQSVNPARSLGPWVLGAPMAGVWVYLVAPMVGATLGWLLYRVLQLPALEGRSPRPDPPSLPWGSMSVPSPRISAFGWGWVETDAGRFRDAKLWPGGGRNWDWEETGTHHRPGVQPADVEELLGNGTRLVIVGCGQQQRLGVMDETRRSVEAAGAAVEVLPSREAVDRYNRSVESGEPVGILLHSTC